MLNPVRTCALFLAIFATSPGCEKPQDAAPQGSAGPSSPYSIELRDGQLRVFHGSPPVLSRCRPDSRPVLQAEERRDLLLQEEEMTRKWRLARARMETNTWPSEDDEHDARLETTGRLERFLEAVP